MEASICLILARSTSDKGSEIGGEAPDLPWE